MADETTALHYTLPLASLLAMLLVAVAASPHNAVARGLALRPLTWLGERSYSLYVWHWPIFQATRPGIDTATTGVPNFLVRMALTFAVAELSYRFVETPLRNGSWRRIGMAAAGWSPRVHALGLTAGMVAVAVALTGSAALVRRGIETAPKAVAVLPVAPAVALAPSKPIPASTTTAPVPALHFNQADKPEILKLPTMLLGDSVLLGVSQWLGSELNVVKVDAVVARQATEVRKLAEHLAAEAELPPVVVINLGNNGTIDEATFRSTMDALHVCRRVVVVNARVPRKWQDDGDDLIARLVPDYPNAVLADWRAASEGHPEYLNADGVHANVQGAKAYTALVVNALVKPSNP